MGIPYSREINAAFDQVTPLVAAGFKVLKTTKNISILLAVIQVLTVLCLFLILWALVLLMYCVNPDLEEERRQIVTPLLKSLARISLWNFLRGLASFLTVIALGLYAGWRLFLFRQWVEDVEYEGNVDADKALEEIDEGKKKGGKKDKGKKKGKNEDPKSEEQETK